MVFKCAHSVLGFALIDLLLILSYPPPSSNLFCSAYRDLSIICRQLMNRDDSERMAIKMVVREVWSESSHDKQEITFHEFKPFFLRFHKVFKENLTKKDGDVGGRGSGVQLDYSLWAKS